MLQVVPGMALMSLGTSLPEYLPPSSIAFAPKEKPVIAISVYVEFSGMGGRAAASIAGLLIEKYLKGNPTRPYIEDYVMKGDFLD